MVNVPIKLGFCKVVLNFIFLWTVCLIGCKKEESYKFTVTVNGYFINSIDGDSIPNTVIEIWEDDHGGSKLLTNFDRKIYSGISDSNGKYSITFTGNDTKTYGIIGYKENYNNDGWVELIKKSKLSINIYKVPLAWLKIHIKNDIPINPNDSIHFYNNIYLSGNVDTTFFQAFNANSQKFNNWDITLNNMTTPYYSFNSCNGLDTCTLNIFY